MNRIIEEDAEVIAKSKIKWEKLDKKTLLVAGATGYVPQNFIHGILKHNDLFGTNTNVVALCRNEKKAEERFGEYKNRSDFQIIISDVCDPVNYEGKIDYIIHAASPAGIKDRYADYVATFRSNVIGCDNLLAVARKHNAVFMYMSSVDVYGKMDKTDRLKEDMTGKLDPLELRNMYSCAKRASETLCLACSMDGIACKIVRPFQIMGSGIPLNDGRLHVDFIRQMLQGDRIVLKGDGSPRRTFLYVTDAIIGMLMVMIDGKDGEAYNVVSEDNEASVLELAQTMSDLVADRKISIDYNYETRAKDPAVTKTLSVVCGDSEKIRELGWKPEVSLLESCRRMMECYGLKCKMTENK